MTGDWVEPMNLAYVVTGLGVAWIAALELRDSLRDRRLRRTEERRRSEPS